MRIDFFMSVLAMAPLIVMASAPAAKAADEPDYVSVHAEKPCEIRQYGSYITASVIVQSDAEGAGNAGFRPLADYIFGNNTAQTKIEMTAPVVQQPKKQSQKIEMTAPVTQTPTADGNWVVSFIMPAQWTMETLPKPNDPRVIIEQHPGEMLAIVKFSGGMNEKRFRQRETDLERWLTADPGGVRYEIAGPMRYAFYNGPWVPGPFKRNEIMVPVRAAAG